MRNDGEYFFLCLLGASFWFISFSLCVCVRERERELSAMTTISLAKDCLLLFARLDFVLRLVSGGSYNSGAPSSLYEFLRQSIYCHNCDCGDQLECMEF